jgi:hypothetical protein
MQDKVKKKGFRSNEKLSFAKGNIEIPKLLKHVYMGVDLNDKISENSRM